MFFLPSLLGAIGTGLQVGGGLFGASSRRKTAETNFQINQLNAGIDRENNLAGIAIEEARTEISFLQAQTNAKLALLDAEARDRNADRIRLFAEARTKSGRQALRRQRMEFDRFESSQLAAVAASGVETGGSPMEVMAESAGQMQLAMQDLANSVNQERTRSIDEAILEQFGAAQERTAANAGLRDANIGKQLQLSSLDIARDQADSRYASSLFGAQAQRASQFDTARAQTIGAASSLFAGIGGWRNQNERRNFRAIS